MVSASIHRPQLAIATKQKAQHQVPSLDNKPDTQPQGPNTETRNATPTHLVKRSRSENFHLPGKHGKALATPHPAVSVVPPAPIQRLFSNSSCATQMPAEQAKPLTRGRRSRRLNIDDGLPPPGGGANMRSVCCANFDFRTVFPHPPLPMLCSR
ncbi:hypothetical protein T440DRAFT_107683 [Plenodomus tracheiphilus IPT5]|uniref:Uncharacterized protein n=1 Tax=Plenodomus tracheiphilus IPT5 TaxID=1408161 RepID=A0A6A7BLT7_9PLEO|nr:hypothetical protein T440DRAFT_107683 [Plenodomus tracheiphilus IPT5]